MLDDEIRVSSEIDAYCTRCRLVTNHRVVAMQDGIVKRVICLTCDGQHNFRPPPGQKRAKGSSVRRIQKERKRVREEVARQTFQQWLDLKEALETEPVDYNMSGSYEDGQAINHSKFGLGFIIKTLGAQKIEVMFEKEIKTLAMNH